MAEGKGPELDDLTGPILAGVAAKQAVEAAVQELLKSFITDATKEARKLVRGSMQWPDGGKELAQLRQTVIKTTIKQMEAMAAAAIDRLPGDGGGDKS